jgi:hypothetical protein
MVHLVASQCLPKGLGASRVESSAVLQAPDSQHAPNLVPIAVIVLVAIEDDSGSVAGHSEQANGDRTDIWRTDETAVESQYSGSAVTQYGDEPITSFGAEGTHPQDVTNRTSASKVVGDVDNDGNKDSNDRELVDKNGDGVVSAQEAGVLEDARLPPKTLPRVSLLLPAELFLKTPRIEKLGAKLGRLQRRKVLTRAWLHSWLRTLLIRQCSRKS